LVVNLQRFDINFILLREQMALREAMSKVVKLIAAMKNACGAIVPSDIPSL